MNKKQEKQNNKSVESLGIADQNLNPNVSKPDEKLSQSKDGDIGSVSSSYPPGGSPGIADLNKFQQFLDTQPAKILITTVSMLILFGTTVLISYLTVKLKNSSSSVPPASERETKIPEPQTEQTGEATDSKTYQFEKSYESSHLKFQIKHPVSWQVKEGSEGVEWYMNDSEQSIFAISWLNPDYVYDVESVCRDDLCEKVIEVVTKDQKLTINILKPTTERLKSLDLPESYLFAEISNLDERVVPTFSTNSLQLETFDQVISTFQFLDQEVKGIAVEVSESCLERETGLLEEISECEIIDEHRCLYLKEEFDSCVLACEKDLENQMCLDICKPVCDSL